LKLAKTRANVAETVGFNFWERREYMFRITRIFVGYCLVLVLSSCGDDSTDGNTPSVNNGNNSTVSGTTESRTFSTPDETYQSRATPIEGGFVAGFATNTGATVARFDEALETVWAVKVGGIDGFSHVAVDSKGRIIVIGQAGSGPARIVRLNGDGTLDRAVKTPAYSKVEEVVALPDGRMMFNDSTLVDEDFNVISNGNSGGQRIIKATGGFLVMNMQGLMIRKLDTNGRLQWTTTVDLAAANYYTIGLRELPDGSIMAAVSGDTNPDHTLVAAHFDAEGNLLSSHEPKFEAEDQNGYSVPLQFGSGLQMTGKGDKTYVSFLANSGGLGSDIRTRIVAELETSGSVKDAFFGGGGLAFMGDKLISTPGGIIATTTMKSECLAGPTILNRPLEHTAAPVPAPAELADILTYEFMPLETVTVTPFDMQTVPACPAPNGEM